MLPKTKSIFQIILTEALSVHWGGVEQDLKGLEAPLSPPQGGKASFHVRKSGLNICDGGSGGGVGLGRDGLGVMRGKISFSVEEISFLLKSKLSNS